MIKLNELRWFEHKLSTQKPYNRVIRFEIDRNSYENMVSKLDGKSTKHLNTFWDSIVSVPWIGDGDNDGRVKVIRADGVEYYSEEEINNTKE